MEHILECKNLSMNYNKKPVVKNISFSISSGDYLCIVGENGSGKSTLIKGLLGLLPPSEGKIELHGIKQNEIGYLPQQTIVQRDFPASVKEVVMSGCLNRRGLRPFYTKKEKERADFNLSLLHITDLQNRSYRDLSGGQQQRVLLARALCATDRLLLLDEPVAGLDPVVTAELYALIKKLNEEKGMTIIMVSHDIHCAVRHARTILHMNTKAAFYGDTHDYLLTELCHRMIGCAHKETECDFHA